jgi:hypothetical protein
VVGPLGVIITGVVAMALVGVLGVPVIGVDVMPNCGVFVEPPGTEVTGVPPGVRTCGVTGVPPFAIVVCAAAVCLANSSIIAIGFSADGSGETNSPGGIGVGVASGADDNDCVQAAITTVDISRLEMISKPRLLFLIESPRSLYSSKDGSTSCLRRQVAYSTIKVQPK